MRNLAPILLSLVSLVVIACGSPEIKPEGAEPDSEISSHVEKPAKQTPSMPTPTSQVDGEVKDAFSCKLTGGEIVEAGWAGKDTGENFCNQCRCMNGNLGCTKMACQARPTPTASISLKRSP